MCCISNTGHACQHFQPSVLSTSAYCYPALIELVGKSCETSDTFTPVLCLNLQYGFQLFLLFLVVICIPWLLIPKPLILRHQHKKRMVFNVYYHFMLVFDTYSVYPLSSYMTLSGCIDHSFCCRSRVVTTSRRCLRAC
jgi:hypothetical protein